MRIRFVADGERDRAMLPPIVQNALAIEIEPEFVPWPTIRNMAGYNRKLQFATIQAISETADGLVVVVDRDKSSGRLKELWNGREEVRRTSPPLPTAIGEADPHVDVWIVDDPVAIRRALGMDGNAPIESVRHCDYPKDYLSRLIRDAGVDDSLAAMTSIAEQLECKRCNHQKETGFKAFLDDLLHEFREFR